MVIVMKKTASMKHISEVIKTIEQNGFKPHVFKNKDHTIIGIMGNKSKVDTAIFEGLPGVERVRHILQPFKLASREFKPENTEVVIGDITVGGKEVVVMAGPCAVENRETLLATAVAVKKAGARILRGGAFKPRTSPYSFQGLGKAGLELLREVKGATGLAVVTEVISASHVDMVSEYVDIIQIGARNMQNFALLEAVGKSNKPVLLKRGLMSSLEELLMSAEYILSNGNYQVMLCERGIRTFEKYTRNTLDISAVPLVKKLSHLPIIVDPSHATGERDLVGPVARAGVAAGADGLIIEVHPEPEKALSDGPQSLRPEEFAALMGELKAIAKAIGRTM